MLRSKERGMEVHGTRCKVVRHSKEDEDDVTTERKKTLSHTHTVKWISSASDSIFLLDIKKKEKCMSCSVTFFAKHVTRLYALIKGNGFSFLFLLYQMRKSGSDYETGTKGDYWRKWMRSLQLICLEKLKKRNTHIKRNAITIMSIELLTMHGSEEQGWKCVCVGVGGDDDLWERGTSIAMYISATVHIISSRHPQLNS